MSLTQKLIRGTLAAALLGSLSACVVAPPHSAGYRAPSVYVETYPTYRYGYPNSYPNTYYNGYGNRHYDNRHYDNRGSGYGSGYYRNEGRYVEPRRMDAPIPSPAQVHRDVRRSLGLPRLPGMP